jgi:hypothetical protein
MQSNHETKQTLGSIAKARFAHEIVAHEDATRRSSDREPHGRGHAIPVRQQKQRTHHGPPIVVVSEWGDSFGQCRAHQYTARCEQGNRRHAGTVHSKRSEEEEEEGRGRVGAFLTRVVRVLLCAF